MPGAASNFLYLEATRNLSKGLIIGLCDGPLSNKSGLDGESSRRTYMIYGSEVGRGFDLRLGTEP